MSIKQRINTVWELTQLCYAWNHDDPGALPSEASNTPLRLRAHDSVVYDACFDPSGTHILSASWDGTAALLDVATTECLARIRIHRAPVIDIGFAPDGTSFFSLGEDGSLRTWPIDPQGFADRIGRRGLTAAERDEYGVTFSPGEAPASDQRPTSPGR